MSPYSHREQTHRHTDRQPQYTSYLAPGGGLRGIVFTLSVCMCVSVCPANILIFYLSVTRRDIDLKLIQATYRVVLDSLKNN